MNLQGALHYRYLKIALCCALSFAIGCVVFCSPYQGQVSDYFDGNRFYNLNRTSEPRFGDFLRWIMTRNKGAWQRRNVSGFQSQVPARVGSGELRVTFVNHSTFFIQMDGLNILTDPIWSERASPVQFIGPRRMQAPGIAFEELPPIDVVLISHNHYDHLDTATLKRLARRDDPVVITTLGNRILVERQGLSHVIELDWWQETVVAHSTKVICVPAQHFSGRGLFDSYKTLWAGFVLENAAGSLFFAGDTGFGEHFEQIAQRFHAFRLALLPIGAFKPAWFMAFAHMSPAEAVAAHLLLHAHISIGMHFGTFPLADDGQDDPVAELGSVLSRTDLGGTEFWVLENGESREVPGDKK